MTAIPILHLQFFDSHFFSCAPLPINDNDYYVNKEENNANEEDYATISDIRGVDVIQVTSNEAYGTSLQGQRITLCDQDIYEESTIYDLPL